MTIDNDANKWHTPAAPKTRAAAGMDAEFAWDAAPSEHDSDPEI